MSLATYTPAAGGFDDRGLSAFLATVPAAEEYDLDELFAQAPARTHRPHRRAADQAAINKSLKEDL